MAQSGELAAEVRAMRIIERAYATAEALPEKARTRVLGWAAEQFCPEKPDKP